MKREDTKAKNFDILHFVADNAGLSTFDAIEKAYYMGVSEQEPCEDAVSREDVIKAVDHHTFDTDDGLCLDEDISIILEELPSVTPTRKKGKWINKSYKGGCGITFDISECTCCGKYTFFDCDELIYKYCPNCGARMGSES